MNINVVPIATTIVYSHLAASTSIVPKLTKDTVNSSKHTHMYIYTHTYTRIHIYTHACTHAGTRIHTLYLPHSQTAIIPKQHKPGKPQKENTGSILNWRLPCMSCDYQRPTCTPSHSQSRATSTIPPHPYPRLSSNTNPLRNLNTPAPLPLNPTRVLPFYFILIFFPRSVPHKLIF